MVNKLDYIVVGFGIAGLAFCEHLTRENKSFLVFDSGEPPSTVVSGGLINPVVLKRFNATWKAHEYLRYALSFYEAFSKKYNVVGFEGSPIFRILKDIEEQNKWVVAGDKKELFDFISAEIVQNTNPNIDAPFGFGEVTAGGRIYPSSLIETFRENLILKNQLKLEKFQYNQLKQIDNTIRYNEISALKIVFAEGVGAKSNPFFPREAIIGNKGEYIIIKAPRLELTALLKGSIFMLPLGGDLYKAGATYKPAEYSLVPTAEAREELIKKVQSMIGCDFEVVDQLAGVRPTTRDRRPLVGRLIENAPIAFLNGLGTRGLSMAPLLAKQLYEHLEYSMPMPKEVDIRRLS